MVPLRPPSAKPAPLADEVIPAVQRETTPAQVYEEFFVPRSSRL
jgi:hypothetical protein